MRSEIVDRRRVRGVAFAAGRARAWCRIGFDLCRSVVRPVSLAPPDGPVERRTRPATDTTSTRDWRARPRLTLLTWNIHRDYRPDAVHRSLAGLIEAHDPDLVLLQEVPISAGRAFWELPDVVDLLARYHLEYVAMHRVHRQSAYYDFEQTGLVTLSRARPELVRAIPLPVVSQPKLGRHHSVRRVALRTDFVFGDRGLVVCNLHLENTARSAGRAEQLDHVLGVLAGQGESPAIVAGDFNMRRKRIARAVAAARGGPLHAVAIGGHRRLLPLVDHVVVRGVSGGAGRVRAARGSDHLPVSVEVELG